jgi:hypothetical protein
MRTFRELLTGMAADPPTGLLVAGKPESRQTGTRGGDGCC